MLASMTDEADAVLHSMSDEQLESRRQELMEARQAGKEKRQLMLATAAEFDAIHRERLLATNMRVKKQNEVAHRRNMQLLDEVNRALDIFDPSRDARSDRLLNAKRAYIHQIVTAHPSEDRHAQQFINSGSPSWPIESSRLAQLERTKHEWRERVRSRVPETAFPAGESSHDARQLAKLYAVYGTAKPQHSTIQTRAQVPPGSGVPRAAGDPEATTTSSTMPEWFSAATETGRMVDSVRIQQSPAGASPGDGRPSDGASEQAGLETGIMEQAAVYSPQRVGGEWSVSEDSDEEERAEGSPSRDVHGSTHREVPTSSGVEAVDTATSTGAPSSTSASSRARGPGAGAGAGVPLAVATTAAESTSAPPPHQHQPRPNAGPGQQESSEEFSHPDLVGSSTPVLEANSVSTFSQQHADGAPPVGSQQQQQQTSTDRDTRLRPSPPTGPVPASVREEQMEESQRNRGTGRATATVANSIGSAPSWATGGTGLGDRSANQSNLLAGGRHQGQRDSQSSDNDSGSTRQQQDDSQILGGERRRRSVVEYSKNATLGVSESALSLHEFEEFDEVDDEEESSQFDAALDFSHAESTTSPTANQRSDQSPDRAGRQMREVSPARDNRGDFTFDGF